MRLRRVVMSGFKTFAKHSEVELEPGITAIVGPNGSGKSNLVDAIRWALGETNARELRGARMDEVIYSGGNGRARMGYAEVELILDNEDGRLPVPDIEVSVSRRVVRHGESDFRLNGDRVRLRDIERVLGTTGLTQSGYAVVAQNDIDAIIEASPAQRRALVEQAAGVRSLRAACEDALGRIGHAEVTLRRFHDLLAEIEPRLAELAVQAGLAIEQRELAEQLGSLRGSLAREAWRAARAQLKQAQRRLDAAQHRFEAAATAEAAFTTRLGGHRARLEQQRTGQREAVARLEETRLFAERSSGDLRRSVERARAGVLGRAAAVAALRTEAADLGERLTEVAGLADDGGAGAAAAESLAGRRDQARRVHQDAIAEALRGAAALAADDEAARAAEDERMEAESMVGRHGTQLRLVVVAAEALRGRVEIAAAQVATIEAGALEATLSHDRTAAAATAAEGARAAADGAAAEARGAVDETQSALDQARQAARTALARAAALKGQVEGALGGPGAIAAAVAAGDLTARRLLDCFSVIDPADGPAVEAGLEAHLGAWVLTDLDAAASLLDAGSAREEVLLEQSTAQPPPPAHPGARALMSCVRADPAAEGTVAACLDGAWLVADRALARRLVAEIGGRAVLPDGTVVTESGIRGGGRPGHTLVLASHERDAASLAERAMDAERAAEASRASATAALASAEAEARQATEQLQTARVDAAEAAARAAAFADSLAVERVRLAATVSELTARDEERDLLTGADGAASLRLKEAHAGLGEARLRADAARAAVLQARSTAVAAAEALRAVEVEEERVAADLAERRRRVDAATVAAEDARSRCASAELRLLTTELDVLVALAHSRAARAAVAQTSGAVAAALAELSSAAPGLAESERAVAALGTERSEVAVVLARAADERAAAEGDVAGAASRVIDLADAVRGDDEDDGPEPQAGDAERAEREIVRLERRVAALGPVNALAPEEHERLAARVRVLRAGSDDLAAACNDIRLMAKRLTSAIDSRFEAVFGAVSVHFHELFAELFPGGRATLRREEPAPGDDIGGSGLSSRQLVGVEILAQPPGKKLQPLSLFSGGERALTALAVILALQQVNPSPFYVFDEVDAPLDDSNVLRFTRLLKRLSAGQQFIVVTHNHITMAAADALHGVTSNADGISSVISVRFDAGSGEAIPEGHVVGVRESTLRAAV